MYLYYIELHKGKDIRESHTEHQSGFQFQSSTNNWQFPIKLLVPCLLITYACILQIFFFAYEIFGKSASWNFSVFIFSQFVMKECCCFAESERFSWVSVPFFYQNKTYIERIFKKNNRFSCAVIFLLLFDIICYPELF